VYLVLKSVQKTNSVRADRAKQVVLVTDGIISYTIDVLDTVREMAPTTRTFVFDIGAGLSHHVAQAIARAGLGDVEYAADLEPLDAKVKRQLARACQPRPSERRGALRAPAQGRRVRRVAGAVHTLFDGDAVVVHALLDTRADTDEIDATARRSMRPSRARSPTRCCAASSRTSARRSAASTSRRTRPRAAFSATSRCSPPRCTCWRPPSAFTTWSPTTRSTRSSFARR
jgi:hypothetical protein